MAFYTVQVKTICESLLGYEEPQGYEKVDEILTESAPLIFSFDFPIYDENYRLNLEKKILKHYYNREIGAETPGLWKLWLDEKLNLIMPYYNQLYKTTLFEFNPLYDVDLTTDHKGNNDTKRTNLSNEMVNSTEQERADNSRNIDRKSSGLENQRGENSVSASDSNVSKYSDTPQGSIKDLAEDRYLTNATIDNGTNKSNSTDKRSNVKQNDEKTSDKYTINDDKNIANRKAHVGQEQIGNTESYIQHVVGTNGNRTYVSKIMEFRKSLLNIDAMIIEELSDLFMGLWG